MFGLVVGIANYKSINSLPESVINDACDLNACLVDETLCGYRADNVRLLTDEQAEKDDLLAALEWLAEVSTKDSTVFVYFSGHGGRITQGDFAGEYLLPADCSSASDEHLAESSLHGGVFAELLRRIQAKKMILTLDCCHASGVGQAKDVAASEMKGGLSEEYLEMLKAGRGRVVFASSRESEYSYVLPGERNSVFTTHLLAGMRGAVPSPDGLVRVFDLFHYLQPLVTAAQPKQHPVFKCEVEENFPIALALGGKSSAAHASSSVANDEYRHDVFINYSESPADKDWVKTKFLPALEAKGVSACVDFRDFGLGKPIDIERERCVQESRYTLTVLSEEFIANKLRAFETSMADKLEDEDGRLRIVGVLLDNCTPHLRFRCRTLLGMEDEDDFGSNIVKLADFLTSTGT